MIVRYRYYRAPSLSIGRLEAEVSEVEATTRTDM
jgi:hypothetical protein